MRKMSDVIDDLVKEGRIDERRLFSIANAKTMPQGYGFVGLGINNDKIIVTHIFFDFFIKAI